MRILRQAPLLVATLALAACGATRDSRHSTVEVAAAPPTFAGTVETVDGDHFDYVREIAEGRAMVLVFWQPGCRLCLAEAPELAEAARTLAGRATFVGIVPGAGAAVDAESVQTAAAELGFDFVQVEDRDLALTRGFGVRGTPTLIAVTPHGRVAWRGHELPSDWRETFASE